MVSHAARKSVWRRRRCRCDNGLAVALAVAGLAEARVAIAQSVLVESGNWSGYDAAAPGEAFTDVSATWVVPTLVPTSSGKTYSSYWAGDLTV